MNITVLIVALRLIQTTSGLDAQGTELLRVLVSLSPEACEKINNQLRQLAA